MDTSNTITASSARLDRRGLMKLTGAGVATFATASLFNLSKAKAQGMTADWDKTFPRSDKVDHRKVTFKNRYGITLAGDLYRRRTIDRASDRWCHRSPHRSCHR